MAKIIKTNLVYIVLIVLIPRACCILKIKTRIKKNNKYVTVAYPFNLVFVFTLLWKIENTFLSTECTLLAIQTASELLGNGKPGSKEGKKPKRETNTMKAVAFTGTSFI